MIYTVNNSTVYEGPDVDPGSLQREWRIYPDRVTCERAYALWILAQGGKPDHGYDYFLEKFLKEKGFVKIQHKELHL
jgi:hypothetical protein